MVGDNLNVSSSKEQERYLPISLFIIPVVIVFVLAVIAAILSNNERLKYDKVQEKATENSDEYINLSLELVRKNRSVDYNKVDDDIEYIRKVFEGYITWDSFDTYMEKREHFMSYYHLDDDNELLNIFYPCKTKEDFVNDSGVEYSCELYDFRYAVSSYESALAGYTYAINTEILSRGSSVRPTSYYNSLFFVTLNLSTNEIIFVDFCAG